MDDMNQIEQIYRNEFKARKEKILKYRDNIAEYYVKIGYELKQIKARRLYENEGYTSFEECVETEIGMERTAASKAMHANDVYSINGNSEEIKPHLKEKLRGLGKSLLIEMSYLPEEDYELITPDTGISDLRALRKAEKEQEEKEKSEQEQLKGQTSLINNFPETVPDSDKPKKEQPSISDVLRELFRPRDMKERLDALVNMDPDSSAMEWWIEDFTKTKKVFNKPPFFLYFHEKEMKIKNVPAKTIETKSYKNFYFMIRAAFHQETAKGTDVWYQAFGEEWEAEQQEEEKRQKEEQEKLLKKQEAEKKKLQQKKKKAEKAENVDFPQYEDTLEAPEKEPETTEIRSDEPEVVHGEVENIQNEDKNEMCDIAQEAELLNKAEKGYAVTLPAKIGQRMYRILGPIQDQKACISYIYPYLYEIRGEKNIRMIFHKENGDSGDVNIFKLKEKQIYADLQEAEKEKMRLNGEKE